MDADKEAALNIAKFESDIPKLLVQILHGDTISTGCGGHEMKRDGNGVKLSRQSAQWIADHLSH